MRVLVSENERVRKGNRNAMLNQGDALSFARNGRVSLTLQEMGECIFQTLEMGECITANCQRSSQTTLTTWNLKTFTATM